MDNPLLHISFVLIQRRQDRDRREKEKIISDANTIQFYSSFFTNNSILTNFHPYRNLPLRILYKIATSERIGTKLKGERKKEGKKKFPFFPLPECNNNCRLGENAGEGF